MSQVLIIEDEAILAKNLRSKLHAHGHTATIVHSGESAVKALSKSVPDVVLLDVRLPDIDGISLLPTLKAESPATSFIVLTAHGNERIAVDAMKAGAAEYLAKPVDLDELLMVVDRSVEQQQISENLSFLRTQEEQRSGLNQILGESAATLSLKETIRKLTRSSAIGLTDPPIVLITGETGTGKDLAARAIHYEGPRRTKPFIQLNCTAVPATLFESELFGHVSGAFTGAAKAKRGLFEVAQGGTLFLDEIGHMSPEMQAKILQAIEQREIRPVGATENRPINVHIIAATNRNLHEAVEKGEFRRDLYHRLRVVEIRLAPLRERMEDLVPLLEHFLATSCRRFGTPTKQLSDEAMTAIRSHAWPGNVRELQHLLESAVLQTTEETIRVSDLRMDDSGPHDGRYAVKFTNGRSIVLDFNNGGPTLDEVEQTILQAAYDHWDHNLSRAARCLGITREALRYRLNKSTSEATKEAAS